MAKDKTLLLIDSHALIHRAFHAFPPDLTTANGEVVNAVYGFTRLLLEVLERFEPDYAIAAMDVRGKTVRHQKYGQYKANRSKTDDLLIQQIPMIEELLAKFDIPVLGIEGFEADDVIGTLDKRFSKVGQKIIVVTGDRDLFQLVDNDTNVFLAGSSFSKSKLYDAEAVEEKMGVRPDQIIDLKSLEGDPSDNIPGVAGVGKKGAATMLQEFETLEGVYKNIDKVNKRYQKKLEEGYEMAKLSQDLATIITDVPFSFDFEDADFGTFEGNELRELFQYFEFGSLLRRLDKFIEKYGKEDEVQVTSKDGQLSLMGGSKISDIPDISDTDEIKNDRVFITHGIKTDEDPLQWKLAQTYIYDGNQTFRITTENAKVAVEKLAGNQIVGVDVKPVIHALLNMELDVIKLDFYDLAMATYLCSYGRVKQESDAIIAHYKQGYADSPLEKLAKFSQLWAYHEEEVSDSAVSEIILMEHNVLPVVIKMERKGMKANKEKLANFSDSLEQKLKAVEKEIFDNVGHEFNVGSPKQVGEVLFEEKGLPVIKKTKSGSYSTDERSLKELLDVDPVVSKILEYREIAKLLSTYTRPLPKLVNPDTGRIHAVFNQLGAITGRFSSQNPNMQNLPVGETAGVSLRSAFESEKDKVLVAFDYSQQELRLLAELSGEENLVQAFKDGKDIHAVAASEIFDIPLDKVTKAKRRIGKTINFGVVYGISPFGLADRLKIGRNEAKDFIDTYFANYPKVKKYYDGLLEQAKQDGYVSTIMGRRRSTAELSSRNYALRNAVEREVMNYPLQGSAADIIKKAMIDVAEIMDKYPAKLILQVHDELIFEYDVKVSDTKNNTKFGQFVSEIQNKMKSAIKLSVPIDVGVEVGQDWANLKEIA